MKRKRGDMIGYQKDELLTETASLNLMFNRVFHIEHNLLILLYAKTLEVENVWKLNQLVKQCIDSETYIGLEDMKISI